MLVDTKLPRWGKPIMEKLKEITEKPVTAIINTHTHFDHVSGNERIELHYFGRAHTGGDAWVAFPALGVLHTGDAFAIKAIPIIDANNGGSAVEYPQTSAKAAAALTNIDTVITGHYETTLTMADLKM